MTMPEHPDDAQSTSKVHDVVANDDHTIALGEATAIRGGKTLTYRTAEIIAFFG
jgi:hypothetical protein